MGRKGWAGTPPSDDAEARKRIIDATLRLVDPRGAGQTTVSDIADTLGITRRTVSGPSDITEVLPASAGTAPSMPLPSALILPR